MPSPRDPRAQGSPHTLPNWDDVRLFLALHRAGSLSAAAKPLGLTQPTCGRRLTALEGALGVRLFDRAPGGLRITDAGSALLVAAAAMEQAATELTIRATANTGTLAGVVRIATNEAFACTFLAEALVPLRERYPAITVELVLSNEETDVLKREADIAFRFRPEGQRPTQDLLVARKLGDEPFILYASDAYLRRRGTPVDPAALRGHDVVAFLARHPAAAWCTTAFADATVVLSAPSMVVVGAAVAAGLGVGVLPARMARRLPHLRPVSAVVATGTAWLAVHPDLRRVPRIRVVADELAVSFHADGV